MNKIRIALITVVLGLIAALGITVPASAVDNIVTEVTNDSASTRSVKAHKDDGCWDDPAISTDTKIVYAGYTSAATMRWVQSFRVYEDSEILVYELFTNNLIAVKYIDVAETNTTAGVCYPTTTKYRSYMVKSINGIGPTGG